MASQAINRLAHCPSTPKPLDGTFSEAEPWEIHLPWPTGDQDGFGGARSSDPAMLYVVAYGLEPEDHDDIDSPVFSVSLAGVVEEAIACGCDGEDRDYFTKLAIRLREIAAYIEQAIKEA